MRTIQNGIGRAAVAAAACALATGWGAPAGAQKVTAQFADDRLTVVRQIADINPAGGSFPFALTAFGDGLVFGADDGSHGDEPFAYDGFAAVRPLADIHPGAAGSLVRVGRRSIQSRFMTFGDEILISADDGASGIELWRYDGAGIQRLEPEINPGPAGSKPGEGGFARFGGQLVFTADDGPGNHGMELFAYDGTRVALLSDINARPGAGSNPHQLKVFGDLLVVRASDGANGHEPVAFDGTAASVIRDVNPRGDSFPVFGAALGDALLFHASDGSHGFELWKTDGTRAGTVMVKDINPRGDSYPFGFTALGDAVLFAADNGRDGIELWKTDGTGAGTVMVKDINPRGPSVPLGLTPFGDEVVFAADNGKNGIELWRTDGTADGTAMITRAGGKELNPRGNAISSGFTPRGVVFNGHLVFVADDGAHGAELWRYDGVSVRRITDINPSGGSITTGVTARGIATLKVAGGELVFPADDGSGGVELWGMSEIVGPPTAQVGDLNADLAGAKAALDARDVAGATRRLHDFAIGVERSVAKDRIEADRGAALVEATDDLIRRLGAGGTPR